MEKQLDMLLINVGSKKKVYQELSQDYSACEPPFWCALTAGFIRNNGFSVDILDANGLNLDHSEAASRVEELNPRMTAIVVYGQQANTCTPLMDAVEKLAKEIKSLSKERLLIITGWHTSALPERTLAEVDCDLVSKGEGFYTLVELLQGLPYDQIRGLYYKDGDLIRASSRPQENVPDLSKELCDVAWDLIPWDRAHYRAFNWMCMGDLESRGRYASIFTSLGCPFSCSYCAIHATYGDKRIRYWDLEWVMRQIDTLARVHHVKNINFIDELFVFNPKHFLPIANELIKREYTVNICAFARVDSVDRISEADLRTLKKAGFNWFKLGIETLNEEILDNINKAHYNKATIRNVVEKIHTAGIDLCANYMFGLPGDNYETMQETLTFAVELNCAFPSFFCTMAVPGSDLYREAVKKGIELPDTWEGFAQQGYDFLPLPTEHLTAAEVLEFRDFAFQSYFDNPRYQKNILAKFGPQTLEHIKGMNSIRLRRRILEPQNP